MQYKQRIKAHRNGKQTIRLKGKQRTTAKGIQVVYGEKAGEKAELLSYYDLKVTLLIFLLCAILVNRRNDGFTLAHERIATQHKLTTRTY